MPSCWWRKRHPSSQNHLSRGCQRRSTHTVAIVSEVARRAPGLGALIASLPLITVLGMIWLWRDTEDTARMDHHAFATFWFVMPSLPMFLAIPLLLNREMGFWPTLPIGCAMTVVLYLAMVWFLGQFLLKL